MRKVVTFMKNWRYWVMYLTATIGIIALLSESESLTALVLSKVVGIVLLACTAMVCKRWRKRGVIAELEALL